MVHGSSLKARGLDETRSKWEAHWNSALSEDDLNWLASSAHCNCIRLPIGYFTLGPEFCKDTPFDGKLSQVYASAWSAVRKIVERCHGRGIGVLLDLHAVPGGANGDEHSGTTSGKAELWETRKHRKLALKCLSFIAKEARAMPGVIGIQAVNEACHGAAGMYEFYDDARKEIASIDRTMPLYISDAWDLNAAIEYSIRRNSTHSHQSTDVPIVIDTHCYWTFSAEDTARNPWDIIHNRVHTSLDALNGVQGSVNDRQGAAAVFVGEYSAVLAPTTWEQAPEDQHDQLKRDFAQKQTRTWQSRAAGSSFWTYRMEWMPGGEWGFKEQTDKGNITPPPEAALPSSEVRSRSDHARSQRQNRRDDAVNGHVGYWTQTTPEGNFEHWRYEQGWDLGFLDAEKFWSAKAEGVVPGEGADRIGALDLWLLRRILETGNAGTKFAWEWEQGYRRAVKDWYSLVGIDA
jgi:aryl-phospho-beta-D-glucosidase BglC (GH1 family)